MADFGLIETIKVINGRLVFKNLHINRLYNALQTINVPVTEYALEDRILRLLKYECIENGLKNFRLRIEVQKNRAHDYMPDIAALKWNCTLKPLESIKYKWNNNGLRLTIFFKHKKMIDTFCNLKQTDRKIYDEAIYFARENDCSDALILNENNTIADASIYNVFVVKNNNIYTPPLADAPIDGVLRKLLLTRLPNITIIEQSLSPNDIYNADEIFLTNAIRGIRWVEYIDEKRLDNIISKQVFEAFTNVISEQFGEHLV